MNLLRFETLRNHYRCPASLDEFCSPANLPEKRGYFRFAEKTAFDGQLLGGDAVNDADRLTGVFEAISAGRPPVVLPCAPRKVAENFRRNNSMNQLDS